MFFLIVKDIAFTSFKFWLTTVSLAIISYLLVCILKKYIQTLNEKKKIGERCAPNGLRKTRDEFYFPIVIFHYFAGGVPLASSCCGYIRQLFPYVLVCSDAFDSNKQNLRTNVKLVKY